jgi:hypothetical protein
LGDPFAMKKSLLFLFVLMLPAYGQVAPGPDDGMPVVVIPGSKNGPQWPLRSLQAGLEAFADQRRLAPAGVLRFRLRPLANVKVFEGIALDLVDGAAVTPVPLAADGGFVLAQGGGADARLIATRNDGQFDAGRLPRAEVLSPGVPAGARRLGDVRLECQVDMAVAKKTLGFMATVAINALGGINWCAPREAKKGFKVEAGRPLAQVVLAHGARREVRAVAGNRSYFMAPIADSSWPDDTLIEFYFVDKG